MKASKLPSGSWRVRVMVDKKSYSFTAKTKKEAELKVSEFLMAHDRKSESIREKDAVNQYIQLRSNVLSPTTIRGYKQIQKYIYPIGEELTDRIKSSTIQEWINNLSVNHSPKTVTHIYSLLISSIKAVSPNVLFDVRLPQKKPVKHNVPTKEDISILLKHSEGNLKKAIMLAAFCSCRRGEACALKYEDILDDHIHIHADMVRNVNGEWLYKDMPKNGSSDRFPRLPNFVKEEILSKPSEREIGRSEYIISCNPQTMYVRYHKLVKKLGMNYRYHDLRLFFASSLHAIGIPDVYIMHEGGWKSAAVLNEVYKQVMADSQIEFQEKAAAFFTNNFS